MTEREISDGWSDISQPVVSILCLTYNQVETIRDTMRGFLNQQTDFPFEIVIHDDASTDGTDKVIQEYIARYPTLIKYVRQTENQYSRGQRMLALAMPFAKGRYIAICEGDDYWTDSNKLQQQVTFLEQNPEYVITYHASQPFNEAGDMSADFGGATRDLSSLELQMATPLYTLTTCFRNVISEFPPEFPVARYGDMFCWSLLGCHGKGKFMGGISPAKYRVHDHGVFSKKSYKKKIEMKLLTDTALLAYYSRIGDEVLVKYFSHQVLISSVIMSEYLNIVRIVVRNSMTRLGVVLRRFFRI